MVRINTLFALVVLPLPAWRVTVAQTPCRRRLRRLLPSHASPLCHWLTGHRLFDSTGGSLEYPGPLRERPAWSGYARIRIAIDSDGIPKRTTAEVLQASQPLFGAFATSALATLRFEAARRGLRAVPVTIDIELDYRIAGADSIPTHVAWNVAPESWGLRITTGWESVPRAEPLPYLGRDDAREVQVAVLDALVPFPEADSGRTTCISLASDGAFTDPDASFIRRLQARTPPVALGGSCPATFDPMAGVVGTVRLTRPRGTFDPAIVLIDKLTVWTANIVMAAVRTQRGQGGRVLWCQVERSDPGAPWKATCVHYGDWMV